MGSETKAGFKALREGCGLSQHDVAHAIGKTTRIVGQWETTAEKAMPTREAWEYLRSVEEEQAEQVAYALGVVREATDKLGTPALVPITYYQSQRSYDEYGRDEGPVGWANAVARKTAAELKRLGVEAEFRYPDEGAIPTPGSRY